MSDKADDAIAAIAETIIYPASDLFVVSNNRNEQNVCQLI